MSIKPLSVYAPQPTGVRASPTQLSVDPKGERIVYTSGKSVFIRSIDDPSKAIQYTGHTANTTVARFSPSGYYIASGDASGTVRVWDCAGEELNTKGEFHIISGAIKDLAWDGESKRIIAVGDGKERFGHCISWDTGNSVGEIKGQSSVINSVSIRQQRPYRAATASDDQTIVFYHGAPFKFQSLLKDLHTGFVHGVAFSPDGTYFVSVGADRKIFLFDGKEGTLISEVKDDSSHHTGSILAVSWAPDSTSFATASTDQTVKLWSVESKSVTKSWKIGSGVPDHQVGIVYARADLIISLSLGGDLNYISPTDDTPLKKVSGHQGSITALIPLENDAIVTGSHDGRVCSWTAEGTATIISGSGHTNSVSGFTASSSDILSVGWDDTLRTVSTSTSSFSGTPLPTDAQPKSIATIGDKTLVFTEKAILEVSNGTVTNSTDLGFTPTSFAVSSKLGHLAVGSQDCKLRIYSLNNLKTPLATVTASRSPVSAASYSPDGAYLAAGEAAGKIVLYDTKENGEYGVNTTRWAHHSGRVEGIAWNKEGTHAVSGSLDCAVYVWSTARVAKKAVVRNAHEGGVKCVGWLEGENRIVTGGWDGAVKKWEVEMP